MWHRPRRPVAGVLSTRRDIGGIGRDEDGDGGGDGVGGDTGRAILEGGVVAVALVSFFSFS